MADGLFIVECYEVRKVLVITGQLGIIYQNRRQDCGSPLDSSNIGARFDRKGGWLLKVLYQRLKASELDCWRRFRGSNEFAMEWNDV